MDDLREKVIREIEKVLETADQNDGFIIPVFESIQAFEDALSLLKAQEPVEPIEMINDFYPIGDPLRTEGWKCGKCGQRIAWDDNCCSKCGTAVKWVE